MCIPLVDQLSFEKRMPIVGNCRQQMNVAELCIGINVCTLGTYFLIDVPQCGPNYVFEGMLRLETPL